jgi:hypothetical protein
MRPELGVAAFNALRAEVPPRKAILLAFVPVLRRPGCRSLLRASDRRIPGGAAGCVRQRGFEQEQQAQDQSRREAHHGERRDGELAPGGGKRTERSTRVVQWERREAVMRTAQPDTIAASVPL